MVAKTGLVTAEELLDMPDDGYRYELVRGELRKMAPSSYNHGTNAGKIAKSLMVHVSGNDLGNVPIADAGYLLETDPDTVRAPDLSFVSRERDEAARPVSGFFPGPPDLAVEVISPNDRYSEVAEKVADWLAAGTRMVIVVDPRRRVAAVHLPGQEPVTLAEGDTLEGGDVVPGWRMLVGEIFE